MLKQVVWTSLLVASVATNALAAPRVVVDAGHGGGNTGAPTLAARTFEKRVTLAVARALGAELKARGIDAVMTRTRDEYLTIGERVRRANRARPDCFVSVHANASDGPLRRGVETYLLTREAAESEARRAAVREPNDIAAASTELSFLDAHRRSATLAAALQPRLVDAVETVDRGVRLAALDVLAGVAAPAVLVEIGFLDHPVEGKKLLEPATQRRIAAALAAGIADFLMRERTTEVMSALDAPRR